MLDWFLTLPRATPKARWSAAFFALLLVANAWHAWPDLHDDLAIARWVAWVLVGSALIFLPTLLVVSLGGRMPRRMGRRIPGALKMTPQELHAAIHADLTAEKQRSREL